MRKKNELEIRTGNEVIDGERSYEGKRKIKEWWDKQQR